MKLPDEMLAKANIDGSEEGWRPADFPAILELATSNKLACLGGQFQFRGPIGTAEMYWLNADSTPKKADESWDEYVARANQEVLNAFKQLIMKTNFDEEAINWKHIKEALSSGIIHDPKDHLYFVAYFNQKDKTN